MLLQGDSGGPLNYYDRSIGKWRVVGIVSFGKKCQDSRYPGVNTKISRYLSWIENNLG